MSGARRPALRFPGLNHLREPLADFLMNRFEVTNREYKEFVDAGGYTTEEYWQPPFLEDLGDALLRWTEQWSAARGLPCIRLDCWDESAVLRRYYRERGFTELDAVTSFDTQVRLFEKSLRQ